MAFELARPETVLEEMLAARDSIFDSMRSRIGDLEDYQFLLRNLMEIDVSSDKNYQRFFNRFYKMGRKPSAWYELYFNLLERNKRRAEISFEEVLHEIFARSNAVHPSFASKMIATIDQHKPVYDDQVCRHLGIKKRQYSDPGRRLEHSLQNYGRIVKFHMDAQVAPPTAALLSSFDTSFPQFSSFTNTKKIDVMLWLWRPVS